MSSDSSKPPPSSLSLTVSSWGEIEGGWRGSSGGGTGKGRVQQLAYEQMRQILKRINGWGVTSKWQRNAGVSHKNKELWRQKCIHIAFAAGGRQRQAATLRRRALFAGGRAYEGQSATYNGNVHNNLCFVF